MTFSRTLLSVVACAIATIAVAFVHRDVFSQDYPNRPIRWIVGAAAGGGNDLMARLIGEKLSASFGRRVVVDNRIGASSAIGMELAAKATADGYTLFLMSATQTINQGLGRKLPADVIKDFAAVARMAVTSKRRVAIAPGLPTMHESGLSGYEVVGWYGVVVSAGTPKK